MTQIFADDGRVIPVTKIVTGPCVITQIKTKEKDGYNAIQVGFGNKRNVNKPLTGHYKKLGSFRFVKELRLADDQVLEAKVGDTISIDTFAPGDTIKVTGTAKGRGFQGVVKRHGFHGSPKSHGHKDQLRMPGSIGSTGPAHVFKGVRMGGRMGGNQVTVSNLEVVAVDADKNEVLIKGALPGFPGSLVILTSGGELTFQSLEQPQSETTEQEKVESQESTEVTETAEASTQESESEIAPKEEKTEEAPVENKPDTTDASNEAQSDKEEEPKQA